MGAFGDLMLTREGNDTAANFVRDKIREIVEDPEVAERLCPENIIGGKRLCVDTDYYATYNRDNVTLIDVGEQPIEEIVGDTIATSEGEYEVDAIVIATGFDAMTGALANIEILGRDGALLRERWANGPSSYLGLAMVGYPNLFTVTGPGSPSVFTNMIPSLCSVRSGNLASPRARVYPGAGRSVILVIHESVQTNMENQYAERPG